MRAKRQILSLLLVLLLVWQGFSFANAETGSTQGASIVGSGTGTEASAASSSTISGTGTASSSTISGAGSASKTGKLKMLYTTRSS